MRFKEFTVDWCHLRLSEFVTRIKRKNANNGCQLPLTISAQYGLINQYDFFDKQIASKDMSNYYLIKKGEFAYNKSYSNDYPWGAVKRLDMYEEGALSTLYICFAIQNKSINSDFLTHYFESTKWHKGISDISGEGARNHGLLNMSIDDYFNTLHYIPRIDEQEKISKLLNLITQRIETQSKIIEDLKLYKKIIMDKVLHTYNFEEISIRDMVNLRYLRIIKPNELGYFEGTKKYLSTSSIDENGINSIESLISYNDRPSRASMKPLKDSVWFAKMKNTVKVYLSCNNDEDEFVLSTGFYGVLCDQSKVSHLWIKEMFLSQYFNDQKDKYSEGSSMSGIKDSQLSDIIVKIFKDKNDEKKCIDLFNAFNEKLKIEILILEKLKEQKKYLLSHMFI